MDVIEGHKDVTARCLVIASGWTKTPVIAIQLAGGPHIPLRYGRMDAANEEDCAPEGRLPGLCTCAITPPANSVHAPQAEDGLSSESCQIRLLDLA